MSREKIFHLRALGAQVVLTRSDVNKGHPAYYQDYARRLAQETPGAFYIDQFNNAANPLAHASTTAPNCLPRWMAALTPSWSASVSAARWRFTGMVSRTLLAHGVRAG